MTASSASESAVAEVHERYADLPVSMREARRWLLWRYEPNPNGGKDLKVPHYRDGSRRRGAQGTEADLARMASFDDACAALASGKFEGLGFALGPDGTGNHWQGIDLDSIPSRPHLQMIADDLPGYTEASPSGTGMHAIGYGQAFGNFASNASGVEAYSLSQFFTVSGEGAGLSEPVDLAEFVAERIVPVHEKGAKPKGESKPSDGAASIVLDDVQIAHLRSALSHMRSDDRDIWMAIRNNLKCLGDVGRGLWIDWAKMSDAWRPEDARKWDEPGGDRSDYRAVFNKAMALHWVNPMSKSAQIATPGTAANDDGPLLTEIDLSAMLSVSLTPPRFIIEPIVPRRVVTLLGGHGGLGKTMLALVICAHVAAGRPWGPFEIHGGRAVFLSLEDDASIVLYRLRCIVDEYQLPMADVLANLRVFDGTDIAPELMVPVGNGGVVTMRETPLMGHVSDAVKGAELTVIDNASESYGGNANDPLQVKAFLRRLKRLAIDNDAGLVLLAHIDKASAKNGSRDNSYLGTAAWHNSARSRLALIKDENGPVELRHEKANLGPRAEPIFLRHADHGVLVPAEGGGSREMVAAITAATDADAVYDVLVQAIRAGLTVTAANAGPATAWHVLASLPELGNQFRNAEGKRRVQAALVKLSRDGRIVRAEYKKPDRHTGMRWELPHSAVDIAA